MLVAQLVTNIAAMPLLAGDRERELPGIMS